MPFLTIHRARRRLGNAQFAICVRLPTRRTTSATTGLSRDAVHSVSDSKLHAWPAPPEECLPARLLLVKWISILKVLGSSQLFPAVGDVLMISGTSRCLRPSQMPNYRILPSIHSPEHLQAVLAGADSKPATSGKLTASRKWRADPAIYRRLSGQPDRNVCWVRRSGG